jgi:hypothetical protein
MSHPNFGELIKDGDNPKRDAVHVAVAPATTKTLLNPGDGVILTGDVIDNVNVVVRVSEGKEPVGIVDPFLRQVVGNGSRFWIFLMPRSITDLRHSWSHPAFKDEGFLPYKENEEWLMAYADRINVKYGDLLYHAKAYQDNGSYWCGGEEFEGIEWPDDFWVHYKLATGYPVRPNSGYFFTCAC